MTVETWTQKRRVSDRSAYVIADFETVTEAVGDPGAA
jgi:hypothetical protein